MRNHKYLLIFWIFALGFLSGEKIGFSQHEHPMPKTHEHPESPKDIQPVEMFLSRQTAGTATNPESYPVHPAMWHKAGWNLMTHGYVYLNTIQQSGPRGRDAVFSTNHLMLIARRVLNERSAIMVRTMFSLEPATVDNQQYPLLFQTGETAHGRPIVDGQHPHDLFMEISLQYVLEVAPKTFLHFYFAPVGDPAIGPVAYPHRISAMELPQATLSHHLQDSTHIVFDVLTAGIQYDKFRLEVSSFHGQEPDEHRWDIEAGAIDSWSTRLNVNPASNWSAQVSVARLHEPEELELGDITRSTASITYFEPREGGFLSGSLIWGRNRKSETRQNLNSYLAEGIYRFREQNNVTARFEIVDREELFADSEDPGEQLEDSVFRIKAFTAGYTRDFPVLSGWKAGIGGSLTLYASPSELEPFYGKNPRGFLLFIRLLQGH